MASATLLTALARVLEARTTSPDIGWFAIWEGYGFEQRVERELRRFPRLELPHRGYHVVEAPVRGAGSIMVPGMKQPWPPDLWWPDDQAWFVATDTDLSWSYVGGDNGTVSAVEALGSAAFTRVSREQTNADVGQHRRRT